MTRSDWPSSSRSVLVQFESDQQSPARGKGASTASIQPQSLYQDLVSSQQSSSTKHAFAALHIPTRLAQGSQKRRACLVLPVSTIAKESNGISDVEKVEDEEEENEHTITLPYHYQRYFDAKLIADHTDIRLSIRPHTPLTLSSIFLAATSEEAFQYAQQSQQEMESTLDDQLLRQDDTIEFGDHAFKVLMAEPVLQGIVIEGQTQIFITLDQASSQPNATDQAAIDEMDIDDFAIDERFLAKSVLDGFGSQDGEDDEMRVQGIEVEFEAAPIQDRTLFNGALEASRKRLGLEEEEIDEENCILLDESGLAVLGAFEGDWAIADVKGTGKPRVVKLFSASLSPSPSSSPPRAHLSPVLLQNLHSDGSYDTLKPISSIYLQVIHAKEGNKEQSNAAATALDCPLPIPFADSLSIARVAGPLSINRNYQTLFLGALRSHFEGRKRIIREGDVIAVGFDKGKARWMRGENATEEDEESNHGSEAVGLDLPLLQDSSSLNTAVVYFSVTSLTPELTEPESEEVAASRGIDEAWVREQARVGTLGCVVDTAFTKIVQTGVSKMRVLNPTGWLQIEGDSPLLPSDSPMTAAGSVFGKLLSLVEATLLPHASDYGLHLTVLIKGARGSGKRTLAHWVAQQAGVHLMELNCFDLIADTDARTEGVLRARFEQASSCAPVVLLLRNIEALARKSQAMETGQEPMMATVLQDCIDGLRQASIESRPSMPITVFATTSNVEKCPTGVLGCFKHEFNIEAPSEAERLAMLTSCLQDSTLSVDVNLNNLATQTAALVASDLVDLVSRAQMACVERIQSLENVSDDQVISAGMTLTGKDFEVALTKARLNYSENIGAPKIPNVTWDDVGGLVSVKDDILDTIQLPLEHPELFTDGLKKRSGILLYGPPGTGKTLLAKAVATSCSLNFFSVKGPELLNMYIGESEANVRRVFQRARDAKPCVIFFDELDSIAPKRGNQGDSGGVMDRIVSQLLAELDGMSSSDGGGGEVFVIGATNRPDLLDPALLRPGRFDRMLYLSVSETHADQLNILQALTRKFTLDDNVGDLSVIADQCPFNLTGADFYALCSDAMLKSMTRKATQIDEKIQQLNARSEEERNDEKHPYPLTTQYYLNEMADPASLDIKVGREDFEAALQELVPSVSMQEMQHYRQVQAKFSSPSDEEAKKEDASLSSSGDGDMTMAKLQELYRQTMAVAPPQMNGGGHMNGNGNSNGVSNGYTVNGIADSYNEPPKESKGKGKDNAQEDAVGVNVQKQQQQQQHIPKANGKGKGKGKAKAT